MNMTGGKRKFTSEKVYVQKYCYTRYIGLLELAERIDEESLKSKRGTIKT